MSMLIYNVRLAGQSHADAWILIEGDKIAAVGNGEHPQADTMHDGKGAMAMPGAIDCHVHFREPGLTEKADIASESRAALAGGVTSYLEMPNTKPPTTTIERWQQKMDIAKEKSMANYAFFIGATNDNIDELKKADYTRIPGVKLFMGSSTGNMLVDSDEAITRLFNEVPALVAVHAEDQDMISHNTKYYSDAITDGDMPIYMHSILRPTSVCYTSSKKAADLAKATNHRLHICHITTAIELSLLRQQPVEGQRLITGEVSPHHLMWCENDYKAKGSRIKMNPAVKCDYDRDDLCEAVRQGEIDIVATDHAPHQWADKQGGALKAASGAPLVQFSLPWMLTHFDERTVQLLMCERPAELYNIDRRGHLQAGNYADIILVAEHTYTVTDDDVISKCGWTPVDGQVLTRKVTHAFVNGALAYNDGEFAPTSSAQPLRFNQK